jgi:hypothetical protein
LPAEIPGFMLPKGLEEGFMRICLNTVSCIPNPGALGGIGTEYFFELWWL